jgi:hypothetical protein
LAKGLKQARGIGVSRLFRLLWNLEKNPNRQEYQT